MTVLDFLDLLRTLATRHPEIKAFYTGLNSQRNDSVLQYPCVRVVFPYSIDENIDNGAMTLQLNVSVYVNEARQPLAPSVNVNYNTENSLISENSELYLENDMRDNALRLATHIFRFLQRSEEGQSFSIVRAKFRGIERDGADFTTGCQILFDIDLRNPYICEADDIFNSGI